MGIDQRQRSTVKPVRRPTLYDVARAAGVSHQTVSQVVKGGPNVRAVTREKVERAIAELGYSPNMTARALASSRSMRIGALFFDRYDEIGPTRNMQAAVDHARSSGYIVDVLGVDSSRADEVAQAIDLLTQSHVAGLVVFAPTQAAIDAVEAQQLTVPVVIEARLKPQRDDEHFVRSFDGMQLIVDHLADLGHRSMTHVTGPRSWVSAAGRNEAVRHTAERRGVQLKEVEGAWTARSGYEATDAIDIEGGVTAVLASNDQMALGVIKALRKRGFTVPDDISVAGYDDVPESAYFEPALTTVVEDFEGRGRLAMRRLLAQIGGEGLEDGAWYTPPRLVVRESTAAPTR